MKKILSLILILALCVPFVACKKPDGETDNTAVTYIGIEINPSVELTADKNGIIITAYGANEDGAVLLYGEEANIVGKGYEEAIAYITTLAHELGYLEENDEIKTTISCEDEQKKNEMREKIHATLEECAEKVGVHITAIDAVGRDILRTLKELKERYPENASVQSLTPEKLKMVLSATENGDVTFEVAVEMNNEELIAKINETHEKAKNIATKVYKTARAKADMAYQIALGSLMDSAYTSVYLERATTDPIRMTNTFFYGAVYVAYASNARALNLLEDVLEIANEVKNYPVDRPILDAVAEALGVDDISVFEGEDGITVESFCRATEEILDKNNISETVEETVEDLLTQAKEIAEYAILVEGEYRDELVKVQENIQSAVTNLRISSSPYLLLMTTQAKTVYNECIDYLEDTAETIDVLLAGALTIENFENLVDEAEDKAEEMKNILREDLTEEEKALVAQKQEQIKTTLDGIKEKFDNAMSRAEEAAKTEIERLRALRESK